MLAFDPAKRISALNALEDPYFQDEEILTQNSKSWNIAVKHAAR